MSTALTTVSLDDRYALESGRALMTGIQGIVRLLLQQRRLDRDRALDTGIYITGYQGSPLGGLDMELQRSRKHLDAAGVVFQPGINEELAATAVAGTQLLGELPGRRHDGVVGFWYGKNPGLDRAADAIRHGTISGTAHLGGAVALIGDDPWCKSSTLPSSCEAMARSLIMPMFAPGTVEDVVRLGLHAVAMSRHTGMWTGVKILPDVADSAAIVRLDGLADEIPLPPTESRGRPPVLLAPTSVTAEHDLMTTRLQRAREYVRRARLNRIVHEPSRPRIGVVASGVAFGSVERALADLELGPEALDALGIRLIRFDVPWPLHAADVRELVDGLEELIVVEDKLAFVEAEIKQALYGRAGAPRVIGQEDEHGRPLVPIQGAVDADAVATVLGARLDDDRLPEAALARLAELARLAAPGAPPALDARRTPFFCSGCPHNISTKAAPDQLVGAGIGCHSLIALDPSQQRGNVIGGPQMGGEGAQWIGLAPFTDDRHYVQNMGDGTFHHSGSLALRAAVAANVDVTYKLLYNDAVAMTGGQRPEGKMDVPRLTRWLAVEGVRKIIVTTPEPESYRGVRLDPIASVRHRDDFALAEAELAELPGVTVIIHDDRCATEERRMRKRGTLEAPAERVWINQRVCEGCGDCGRVSTCLSVLPVQTEFGRKTEIHQPSCNQDFACLEGDCPSFLLVRPGKGRTRSAPEIPCELPAPVLRVPSDEVLVRMPGMGGTGVVTLSQIVQMAAHLDGKWAAGIDQTGLAQKGGPVTSDVRVANAPIEGSLRASSARADLLLGLDVIGAAAPDALRTASRERTVAVTNTGQMPTAAMAIAGSPPPSMELTLHRIDATTRAAENIHLDTRQMSESLFGDHMFANMILLGAAVQHGCVPITVEAIERAIELNGAAIETNLAALRWGRAAVVDRDAVETAIAAPVPDAPATSASAERILEGVDAEGELRRLLAIRVADLVEYQSERYAREYLERVTAVAAVERERAPGSSAIAEAHARGLHKLMAYKDEYEVARLHLDGLERARMEAELGEPAKVRFLLHPPLLRALGLRRKIKLGASGIATFRLLRAGRRLRGTWLDPFGRAQVRRTERALIGEHEQLVAAALEHLRPATAELVAQIADLPDVIRGYEQIKLANVERYRAEAQRLLRELRQPGAAPSPDDGPDRPFTLPLARA